LGHGYFAGCAARPQVESFCQYGAARLRKREGKSGKSRTRHLSRALAPDTKEVALFTRALGHARHHVRFYAAGLLGIVVWAVTPMLSAQFRLVVAGDTFFIVYLALMWILVLRVTPDDLRKRAAVEDEGILLIGLLTMGALAVISVSLFAILNHKPPAGGIQLGMAIASVPFGWFMLHTVAAFHYANLFYAQVGEENNGTDAGGFDFPSMKEPGAWEFLYQSFVVGMTAQVSDVDVLNTHMRKVVTMHSVVSFLLNKVVLALAINITAQH
jgi:uncharacterized membrane protein